uniref:Retrotransposon Copia-like N-terminal domain-containing protein n=1 Tax=Cannabis sativa TaxID=3483 RepID=A0A803PZI1_CANSA
MSTEDQATRTEDSNSTPTAVDKSLSSINLGDQSLLVARPRSHLDDPSDPYYLHHGDNPRNVLVSQPLTGQDNYVAWSRAINSPYQSRINSDSWTGCLSPGSKLFGSSFLISDQPIPCNGCTCGGVKKFQEHYNMEYIMSFLMGLSDMYAHVRGNILVMDPLPEINRVFHLVTQEENQRRSHNPTTDPNLNVAFAFHGYKASGNKDNHGSRQQPPKKGRPFCTHCNFHGHTIEKCYKIHGYQPGYSKPNKPKEAAANQVQTNNENCASIGDSHTMLPQLTAA